jgi:hypothetical protein
MAVGATSAPTAQMLAKAVPATANPTPNGFVAGNAVAPVNNNTISGAPTTAVSANAAPPGHKAAITLLFRGAQRAERRGRFLSMAAGIGGVPGSLHFRRGRMVPKHVQRPDRSDLSTEQVKQHSPST